MVNWFGIVVLIICIFLIALTIANIYYFNRIRTGGTISNGTATALAWLNFFFLLIVAILLILSIYFMISRGRKIKVCATTVAKSPPVVTTVETPPVPVVVQTPVYTSQKSIPVDIQNTTGKTLYVKDGNGNLNAYTTDSSGVQKLEDYNQMEY